MLPTEGVSVIICVHSNKRREAMLEAVRSARCQTLPVSEIIVVVDHNLELQAWLTQTLAGVKIIPNVEEPGLSGARNTGIANAKGGLLLFLDDDAALEDHWVQKVSAHFEDENVLGVTSRIVPRWQQARPSWFPDEFLWVIGCTYEGMTPGRVRNLIGAAMCVQRAVFDGVGGFATSLGRSSTGLPMGCEETEFCIRAGKAFRDGEFRYDDAPWVTHLVSGERVTWRYFLRRCYAEGSSKAVLAAMATAKHALSSERRYVSKTLPRGVVRGFGDALRGDVAGLFRATAIVTGFVATAVGYLAKKGALLANPPSPVTFDALRSGRTP
ncbi:glycosyltransferase family 2 protein [Hyphomicrobium sp.]|uniref:glycosyltransferase family 2 protein n=1 Tax=Hyphomicrobium sp. TaxID=82 RepID=UPI002D76F2C6|nr:glycosyltransferase family 2 protein [Hyphomicrobium sp.]HET6391060.1 glycosyltransferase family 2 protein [Hyphomicrobium sp.]